MTGRKDAPWHGPLDVPQPPGHPCLGNSISEASTAEDRNNNAAEAVVWDFCTNDMAMSGVALHKSIVTVVNRIKAVHVAAAADVSNMPGTSSNEAKQTWVSHCCASRTIKANG